MMTMRANQGNTNLPEGGLYPGSVRPTVDLRPPTPTSWLRSYRSSFSQNSVSRQQLHLREVGRDQVGRLHGPGHVGADDVSVGQGQLRQPGARHVGLTTAEAGEDPLLVRLAGQLVLAVPDEDEGPAGRAPLLTSSTGLVVQISVLGGLALVPVVIPPGEKR